MKIAKLLKLKRLQKGALQLASTQVKFAFDEETHNPTDVSFYDLLDTNSMVEEFMLLANVAVAEKILQHFPGKSILRRHSTPKPLMIKEFSNLLSILGYKLDYSSSRSLAECLDAIDKKDDPFFNKLVRIMTTRCMNEVTASSQGHLHLHGGLRLPRVLPLRPGLRSLHPLYIPD
jgi:exosome complex exonuclease DIS3/RRP44